jgi:hypothetical protein
MPIDPFPMSPGPAGPAENAAAATPSASDMAVTIRGFHCNVAGDVVCRMKSGSQSVTFACSAGAFYPYRLAAVLPGTTASIILLW